MFKVGDTVEVVRCSVPAYDGDGYDRHKGVVGPITGIYGPDFWVKMKDGTACIAKEVKYPQPKLEPVANVGDRIKVLECGWGTGKHTNAIGVVTYVEQVPELDGNFYYTLDLGDQGTCYSTKVELLSESANSADSGNAAIPEKKQRWLVAPNDRGRSALYSVNEYGVTKYETDEDNNAPGIWALLVAGVEATKNA